MLISFIFASPCFPIPLSLPIDSQSHIFSVFIFSNDGDDEEVSFLILANSFRIYFLQAYLVKILFPI